jgi:hypothetical protein
VRKDRDDGTLSPLQTTDFETWIPAVNDSVVSDNGTIQSRRAWLPISKRGFLRLQAEEAP